MSISPDSSNEVTQLAPAINEVPAGSVASVPQSILRSPEAGDILKNRFQLLSELGRGGMGIVYKALDFRRQEADDRNPYVAVKILNPELADDALFLKALQRECKRSQNLPHPNIITVFDFDRDERNVFMTMECLEGQTLKQLIQERRQGIPLKESWQWIREMADALSYAHRNGIVHSDFKPGNVLLAQSGIKVLDFGLASLVSKNPDHDRTLIDARTLGAYTPWYASLEMLKGEAADPADDLFALACTVYELLSGKHPYHRLTALQAKEAKVLPKRIPHLSQRQWRALEQALSLTRAERRKTSVSELAAELDPGRDGNHSVSAGLVGSVAVLFGVLVFWQWWPSTDKPALDTRDSTQSVEQGTGRGPGDSVEPRQDQLTAPTSQPQPGPQRSDLNPPKEIPVAIDDAILQQLGDNRAASSNGAVAIGVDRAVYRLGETLEIRLALAKPQRVYVIYVNSRNETALLYPNRQQKDQTVTANQVLVVPPKGRRDFVLRLGKPVGRDRIVVLAAEDKLSHPIDMIEAELPRDVTTAEISIDVGG